MDIDDLEIILSVLGDRERPASIYEVPTVLRDLSQGSFNPRIVAIGPLHRKDINLKAFDDQKLFYVKKLMQRLKLDRVKTVRECLNALHSLLKVIENFYLGWLMTYSDDQLLTMMVVDACFILEFLFVLSKSSSRVSMINQSIIYDLLLIENQIPFSVLERIFECTILKSKNEYSRSLTTHLQVLLKYYNVFQGNIELVAIDNRPCTHDHILSFVHKFYQPSDPNTSTTISISNDPMRSYPKCHTAMELERAWMSFSPNEEKGWAMAMKLDIPRFSWFQWCGRSKPTLRMPILHIDDFTELVLRNLIVYEHISDVKKYVTSYASAMDMLIDTPEDIALLVKSQVIINRVGSNKNAANMINRICKEVPLSDFHFGQQWEEMDAYYNSYWPKTIAGLTRTHFNNPWSVIALFGAFVYFALTITQTIFTIKAA